jgi:hypothetical protein
VPESGESTDAKSGFNRGGLLLIAAVLVTFMIGIAMFLILGTQRKGDLIPIDAAPYYMPGDGPNQGP